MSNHTTHFSGCDCVMDKMQKLEAENARLQKQVSDITSEWTQVCAENVRFKKALERIDNECGRDDTIAWKIAGDTLEALKGGE